MERGLPPAASAPGLTATGVVELADGRALGYRAMGPADGHPILYMHGAIGSPVRRCEVLDELISRRRLRYVAVERPGFGASDPHPGRTVASWATDVLELLDALGHRTAAVVGVSAGAPYALACAALIPERISVATVVSCTSADRAPHRHPLMARRYRLGLGLLSRRPELARRLGDDLCRSATQRPDLVRSVLALAGRGAGSEGLGGDMLEVGSRSLLAGLEAGVGAMVEDYLVACRGWGFEPEAVTTPLRIWHGGLDRVAPPDASRELARRVRDSELRIEPGEGHFFFRRRLEAILAPLIPAAPGPLCGAGPRGTAGLAA